MQFSLCSMKECVLDRIVVLMSNFDSDYKDQTYKINNRKCLKKNLNRSPITPSYCYQ